VRQLEIKVLNIIDARCNHEVYVGCRLENPNNFLTISLQINDDDDESNSIYDTGNFIICMITFSPC